MSVATTTEPTTEAQPTPATSPEPTTATTQDARMFSQADLDRIVNERLERERRRAESEQERVRREAEEARLAEQNEFRTLAEQRAERIVELELSASQVETLATERDAALEVVRELVAVELEGAPDFVRDAISERDPVAQLRYLNQHRDKWATEGVAAPRGTPQAPRGTQANLSREERIAQEIEAQRRRGR